MQPCAWWTGFVHPVTELNQQECQLLCAGGFWIECHHLCWCAVSTASPPRSPLSATGFPRNRGVHRMHHAIVISLQSLVRHVNSATVLANARTAKKIGRKAVGSGWARTHKHSAVRTCSTRRPLSAMTLHANTQVCIDTCVVIRNPVVV